MPDVLVIRDQSDGKRDCADPMSGWALGRASGKSGAANQWSLNMSTPSIAKSRNPQARRRLCVVLGSPALIDNI
jgi:hypothetical protein